MSFDFCILLSTYHSDWRLTQLIESIKHQDQCDWVIFWREDSTSTPMYECLVSLEGNGRALRMQDSDCTGKNLGVAKSFGYLLRNAPKAKYYLFCDHDDLWLPNRLSSIERLANDSDLVIHNAETFIEESGSIGGLVISADEFHKNFYDEIFFQNFAPGCCLAVSDRVREELAQAILNEGTEFFLHDWIALVHARAFNFSVTFIPEPGLQYRIHSGNAVGLPGPVKRLLQIFKDRKVIRYVRSYIESMIKVRAILHRAGFSISFSKLFRTCLSSSFGNSVFRRYFFLVVLVLSQINLGFK